MDCADFSQWLDEGLPGVGAQAAAEHASVCTRCDRAWKTARMLESLLSEDPAIAPSGFIDRTCKRIAAERVGSHSPWLADNGPQLPLWIRIFADPATVLAFVLMICLVAWGREIWSITAAAMANLAKNPDLLSRALAIPDQLVASPFALLPVVVATFLIILLTSMALYKGVTSLAASRLS